MSPRSAGAFCRRASVGIGLLVATWSGDAHAADDELKLDLGASSLELRRIPKGTFTQGSPPTEAGREAEEAQRSVTVSRAFWLGKVPVTRGQFSRFVTETRFVTDAEKGQLGGFGWDGKALVQKKDFTWRNPGFPQKDDDPVVLITFGDANAFVAWASRETGRRVRLPTEAEWEYAARAGTTTPWSGASTPDEALTIGWFKANSTNTTHTVAHKRPNAFGLFDMAGNVYEWCRDVYAPYPPGDVTDPENTTNSGAEPERRVLRGGSWLRDPKRGRSAARGRGVPGTRNAETGFRVAMDDDDPLAPVPAAVPTSDFAPAAPLGMTSASAPGVADASVEAASASATAARPAPEGSGWSLVIAPLAAAGLAVVWVIARRRRGERVPEPVAAPRPPPTPVQRPAPEPVQHPAHDAPITPSPPWGTGPVVPQATAPSAHESIRGIAIAVIAEDERPSPPPSTSGVPTGSPFTSEPNIVASPATLSEALLVRASVVEAGLSEEAIVDVPLTPVDEPEAGEVPNAAAEKDAPPAEDAPPAKDEANVVAADEGAPAASADDADQKPDA